jgi:hypothetical protein
MANYCCTTRSSYFYVTDEEFISRNIVKKNGINPDNVEMYY